MSRVCLWIAPPVFALLAAAVESAEVRTQPPATKVEILQPPAGQDVSGAVGARAKLTPPEDGRLPSSVWLGLGGPPWVEMKRSEQTGEWSAQLDSSLVPVPIPSHGCLARARRPRW